MSHELKEGVKLSNITLPPDPDNGIGHYRVGSESHQAREIVVAEQVGQMAMVPWAKVTFNSGRVELVNLANVESVELA